MSWLNGLLLSIFSILWLHGLAQEHHTIELSGTVYSLRDSMPVSNVHVIHTKDIAVSNDSGKFEVTIDTRDPVVFSAVGYYLKKIDLKQDSADHIYRNIYLRPRRYKLPRVDLVELKKDKALKTDYEEELELPQLKTDRPSFELSPVGAGINGLFTYLYQLWSQKGREIRAYRKLLIKEQEKQKIREKYNPDFVMRVTGLENKTKAKLLMQFCDLSHSFLRQSSQYDIGVAIKECYKKFVKMK